MIVVGHDHEVSVYVQNRGVRGQGTIKLQEWLGLLGVPENFIGLCTLDLVYNVLHGVGVDLKIIHSFERPKERIYEFSPMIRRENQSSLSKERIRKRACL
jgi:hypothetical protein